ncbi:sulfurtransferase complex subunit TusC [Orbaceae bacterium ESL0721]|nr:sulfurtransferase complex subunit TusC [Orbaceae bacterium ESL0721]
MKNIAIIITHPPHGNAKGREALDIALALSDINHITLIFMDGGALHLLPNQQPDTILMRDYIATLKMVTLYDIDDLYIDGDTLDRFSPLFADQFDKSHNCITTNSMTIKVVDNLHLEDLLAQQDTILHF